MYQPLEWNQESRREGFGAKRNKMSIDELTFSFSYQILHSYLFETQNRDEEKHADLKFCDSGNIKRILVNQNALNSTKDMPNMVRLCLSGIPGSVFGVQAIQSIPIGAWIGPYQGTFVAADKTSRLVDSSYSWEIFKDGTLDGYIDGSDENTASWMKFIRCARHKEEQNLYAFQYMNKIYYRTYKTIEPGQELLVWYDDMYTQYMGIPYEGIYDMAPLNETSLLSGPVTKTTEDKMLTPPTTPTKCADNTFNRLLSDVRSQTKTSPLYRQFGCFNSTTPDQVVEAISQIGTRKKPFQCQPIPVDKPQKSTNQKAAAHAQIITVLAEPHAMEIETKMLAQSAGLPTTTKESKTTDLDASTRLPSFCQGKNAITAATAQNQPIEEAEANKLQCGKCKTHFIQRSVLNTHVCPGVLLKPYQCGHCNDTFSSPWMIRLHATAHQAKKPFKCGYCMRSFSGATTLNNHIRSHTGEKPFSCFRCGKTFSKSLQLSGHIKMPGECKQDLIK